MYCFNVVDNDQRLMKDLEDVKRRLEEVTNLVKQSDEWIAQASGETREAEINVTQAENTIKRAQEEYQVREGENAGGGGERGTHPTQSVGVVSKSKNT